MHGAVDQRGVGLDTGRSARHSGGAVIGDGRVDPAFIGAHAAAVVAGTEGELVAVEPHIGGPVQSAGVAVVGRPSGRAHAVPVPVGLGGVAQVVQRRPDRLGSGALGCEGLDQPGVRGGLRVPGRVEGVGGSVVGEDTASGGVDVGVAADRGRSPWMCSGSTGNRWSGTGGCHPTGTRRRRSGRPGRRSRSCRWWRCPRCRTR